MTIDGVSGGLRNGLLQRLFARADSDQSQTLRVDELAGLMSGENATTRAGAIVAVYDQDGDSQLTSAELTGRDFAPETLAGLLSVQEYAAADRDGRQADDRAVVDDFFTRADIDGNGLLSKDEFDAERALGMAQSLDAGAAVPQHLFAVRPGAFDDDVITKDEVLLGRRLVDVAKAVSMDDVNLDPEMLARLAALKDLQPDPATPAAPPVDPATVLGDAVRSAELTQTLIARLMRQLELSVPNLPTQDLTA
jgi:hypothetical protein